MNLRAMSLNPEVVGTFTAPGYYDELAPLRAEAPVREYAPNSWTVARYADVRAVTGDPELSQSTLVRGATHMPFVCR